MMDSVFSGPVVPWVLLSTLFDVPDSDFHSFLKAVSHSLQLSIILTLLSLQLTFHIQKGVFTVFCFSDVLWTHAEYTKLAIQNTASGVTGQVTSASAVQGFH